MKVKTITKYVANDGKEFDTSTDCIYHESKTKPITISGIDSDKLSNLIWGDSECKDYDNKMWSEYLKDKLNTLQSIYNIFETSDKTKLIEFAEKFDYYELGDVITFFEMLRIDVEK